MRACLVVVAWLGLTFAAFVPAGFSEEPTPTPRDTTNAESDDEADSVLFEVTSREQTLHPGGYVEKPAVWRTLTDLEKKAEGYAVPLGEAVCWRPYVRIADPSEVRYLSGAGCERAGRGPSTSVLVARAFQSLTIPKSQIVIQPPGGVTLVNMATLFRTEAVAYDESISLLGRSITLRITPVEFVWQAGDGVSFTTTTPGIAFEKGVPMGDYVSHKYLQPAKRLSPSVDVVWSAQYSVEGGPWQEVDGTVTTTGPGAQLRVREAVPVLTSGG